MPWPDEDRRTPRPAPPDDSQAGIGLQLAALTATFESFSKSVGDRMDRWERDVVKIAAEVKEEIAGLRDEMKADMRAVRAEHVSLDRFKPVERIAYGLVGLVCVAVVGALLKLVVTS